MFRACLLGCSLSQLKEKLVPQDLFFFDTAAFNYLDAIRKFQPSEEDPQESFPEEFFTVRLSSGEEVELIENGASVRVT